MSTNTPESPIEEGAASQNELSDQTKRKLKPGSPGKYRQVQLPSADMIAQEDFMNNCAVRTILSAGMGSLLGIAFGVFMGTMDTSVSAVFGNPSLFRAALLDWCSTPLPRTDYRWITDSGDREEVSTTGIKRDGQEHSFKKLVSPLSLFLSERRLP